MHWKSLAATAAFAMIAAACGSDAPTAPKGQQALDVNTLLAQIAAGDVSQNASAQQALSLPTPLGASGILSRPDAASCAFDSTTQGFVCTPATFDGLHVTLTYWLYDAAGKPLDAPDASKTASIRAVSDVAGSLAPPSGLNTVGSSSVSAHSDMTLSGLLAASRVLNGTSNSHYDVAFDGTTQLHTIGDDTSRTVNVTVPATATNGAYWPTSGSVVSDMHWQTTSASLPPVAFGSHAVLTFEGGGKVSIAVTVAGQTSNCDIDLSGKVAAHCGN